MPSVKKWRDTFSLSRPENNPTLRQRQLPGAPAVGGCIEFPRTWRDCKTCDLDHGQASACDLPIGRAIRQPQNAPVIGDIEVTPDRIKRDARGGKVWESWPS